MALHSELPIYKVAYDLLSCVVRVTRNMPREFKQSIGGKLRDECVDVTVLVFRANIARNAAKVPHIEQLIERLQVAELLLRLARDLRLIATGHYGEAIKLTQSIGKQASGWKRSSAASPAA